MTPAESKRLALLTKRKWTQIRNANERERIMITVSDLRFLIRMAHGENER